ncbi:MAG: D-ornithine 4,5-aminomutase subunit beta, partial [Thermosediminibacterales bacterium]|nr:D-ornithine 4,5-aminomutase subunit beta [Thermosediminibacterales bacterium]
ELDERDNVYNRLEETRHIRENGLIKPEVEWFADGYICLNIFLPTEEKVAEFAAMEIAKKLGLSDVEVIHKEVMQPAEGTYLEVKGKVPFEINPKDLVIPERPEVLTPDEIRNYVKEHPIKIVAATVGEDEHSVGMREIIDIKHGGLEGFGIECHYLGTSVPVEKVVNAAIEIDADAILISTIVTHADIHRINMKKLHELCIEKGIRDRVILVGGGTQVTDEIAKESGLDAGFGRGTKGIDVASFLVKALRAKEKESK